MQVNGKEFRVVFQENKVFFIGVFKKAREVQGYDRLQNCITSKLAVKYIVSEYLGEICELTMSLQFS